MLRATAFLVLAIGAASSIAHAEPGSWLTYEPSPLIEWPPALHGADNPIKRNAETKTSEQGSPPIVSGTGLKGGEPSKNAPKGDASKPDNEQPTTWTDKVIAFASVISALFAVVVGVSTYCLWSTTRDLAASTKIAADAANLSAKAAVGVELPLVRLQKLDLCDWGLGGEMTPIEGTPPQYTHIILTFGNYGRSIATVTKLCWEWCVTVELPATPIYEHIAQLSIGTIIQGNGGTLVSEEKNRSIILSEPERQAIGSYESHLWVYGFIAFRDFLGEIETRLRFVSRWVPVDPGVGSDFPRGFVSDGPDSYQGYRYEKNAGLSEPPVG